jgi:large subunit ribosomal protein L27e
MAGKKAVIVQNSDTGNRERPYGHCVVAGIDAYPKKVSKRMSKKKIAIRSRIKPFIKVVNHRHLMPTRYNMDLAGEFKGKISIADPSKRKASKRNVKKVFQTRYNAGENKWFFLLRKSENWQQESLKNSTMNSIDE